MKNQMYLSFKMASHNSLLGKYLIKPKQHSSVLHVVLIGAFTKLLTRPLAMKMEAKKPTQINRQHNHCSSSTLTSADIHKQSLLGNLYTPTHVQKIS